MNLQRPISLTVTMVLGVAADRPPSVISTTRCSGAWGARAREQGDRAQLWSVKTRCRPGERNVRTERHGVSPA